MPSASSYGYADSDAAPSTSAALTSEEALKQEGLVAKLGLQTSKSQFHFWALWPMNL